MGFWAKFEGGGRSAHYFKDKNSIFTTCGRMRLTETIRVYEEEKLKNKQCRVCKGKT